MLNKIWNKILHLSLPARASLAYMIANIVSKGVSVITVPIYTRLLTTTEIGVGTTYSSWYAIIYSIITLSLTSGSLNIAMMEYKDERNKYESCCLTITSITGVLFLIIYWSNIEFINKVTTMTTSITILLGVSLIFNPALDLWYARQRYEYKYLSSVIVSLSITVFSAVLAIVIIVYLKNTDVDLGQVKVISQGSIQIGFALVFYFYIFIKGKTLFNKSMWKDALVWSLPLIVHSLSKSILDLSDRLMIAKICGKSEAGIYGTVYSFAMLSLIIWNAINTSLIPTTFEKLESNDKESLNAIIQPILVVFGGIAILLTLFAPEILLVFTTKEYMDAVYLIPALSAGIYFTALYNIFGNFLLFRKKTNVIMIGTVVAAISNITLNYIFIKMIGYMVAAYTTLVSFIMLALMQGLMSKKVFGYSLIDTKKTILVSFVVCILCNLCNLVYDKKLIRYAMIGIFIILVVIYKKKIKNIIFPKKFT